MHNTKLCLIGLYCNKELTDLEIEWNSTGYLFEIAAAYQYFLCINFSVQYISVLQKLRINQ